MLRSENPYKYLSERWHWWGWGYKNGKLESDKRAAPLQKDKRRWEAWDKGVAASIKDRLNAEVEAIRLKSELSAISAPEQEQLDPNAGMYADMIPSGSADTAPVVTENPKDAVGSLKMSMSAVPAVVLAELGVAMMEGARKYGRHNYRAANIRASIYFDAVMRHMMAWFEGEDIDPDSGLSHVTKAIASLTVLRDGQINGNIIDDRPPPPKDGWMARLNADASALIKKYPNPKDPVTRSKEGA